MLGRAMHRAWSDGSSGFDLVLGFSELVFLHGGRSDTGPASYSTRSGALCISPGKVAIAPV